MYINDQIKKKNLIQNEFHHLIELSKKHVDVKEIVTKLFDKRLKGYINLQSKEIILQKCQDLLITKTLDYMNSISQLQFNHLKGLHKLSNVIQKKQQLLEQKQREYQNLKAKSVDNEQKIKQLVQKREILMKQMKAHQSMTHELIKRKNDQYNKKLNDINKIHDSNIQELQNIRKLQDSKIQSFTKIIQSLESEIKKIQEYFKNREEELNYQHYKNLNSEKEIFNKKINQLENDIITSQNLIYKLQNRIKVLELKLIKSKQGVTSNYNIFRLKSFVYRYQPLPYEPTFSDFQIQVQIIPPKQQLFRQLTIVQQQQNQLFYQQNSVVTITESILQASMPIVKTQIIKEYQEVPRNYVQVSSPTLSIAQKIRGYKQESEKKINFIKQKMKKEYLTLLEQVKRKSNQLKIINQQRIQLQKDKYKQIQNIFLSRPSRTEDVQYIKELTDQNISLVALCSESNKKIQEAYCAIRQYKNALENYQKTMDISVQGKNSKISNHAKTQQTQMIRKQHYGSLSPKQHVSYKNFKSLSYRTYKKNKNAIASSKQYGQDEILQQIVQKGIIQNSKLQKNRSINGNKIKKFFF